MATTGQPQHLSEKEAAAYIGVSLSTIRRWRRSKTGPAFFQFGGVLRYSRETLANFIAQHTEQPA